MTKKLRSKKEAARCEPRAASLWAWALVLWLLMMACRQQQAAADTYTCPMHPTVLAERPGVCPVCGMDLVRKARPGQEVKITDDLQNLLASPSASVVGSAGTLKVEYKSATAPLPVSGLVTIDPRAVHTVPARVAGRLEAVYVTAPWQYVRQGQKIAVIYSPQLAAAGSELIYLHTHDAANTDLIQAARRRLELLGLSDTQIDDLVRRQETTGTEVIYSPHDGYAVLPAASGPAAMPQSTSGMGQASATSQPPAAGTAPTTLLRQGDYVAAGQNLLTLAGTEALRVELDLPGSYAPQVHAGDTVRLDLGQGPITAPVERVQAFFAQGEDLLKVRVPISQAQALGIGQVVDATLQLRGDEAYWIPRSAVVDLGTRAVVFIKERGIFKPREVVTGTVAGSEVQIRAGLTSQDQIAVHAGYLVDSESFIQTEF